MERNILPDTSNCFVKNLTTKEQSRKKQEPLYLHSPFQIRKPTYSPIEKGR